MKIAEEVLHISLFATILFSAALVLMPSRLPIDKTGTEIHDISLEQNDGAVELPPPCTLENVFCLNKRYMRITEYGWTGNKMANGEWPRVGYVATSDRSIPFGTKVIISSKEYIVGDRTAKWIEKDLGDTIDIYSENPRGLKFSTVYIQ